MSWSKDRSLATVKIKVPNISNSSVATHLGVVGSSNYKFTAESHVEINYGKQRSGTSLIQNTNRNTWKISNEPLQIIGQESQ